MANAFSGGLFLAIALIHILPDVTSEYAVYLSEQIELHQPNALSIEEKVRRLLHGGTDRDVAPSVEIGLPLPYLLVFAGYTFILIVDRVMFDSHVLFDEKD